MNFEIPLLAFVLSRNSVKRKTYYCIKITLIILFSIEAKF